MNLLFPSDWEFIESQLVKYGIEWEGAEQNVIADKERQRVRIENDIYQSINSILHPENFIINVELSIIISSLHDSTNVVTEFNFKLKALLPFSHKLNSYSLYSGSNSRSE